MYSVKDSQPRLSEFSGLILSLNKEKNETKLISNMFLFLWDANPSALACAADMAQQDFQILK